MRFRTKTILGVAVIEMLLLAVLVSSALSLLRESNEAELVRRVQLGGKLLAVAAKDALISQDLATLDSLVSEAMSSNQIAYVRILDASGVVLAEDGAPAILARPFHREERIDQVTDGIFDGVTPVLAGVLRQGEIRIGVSTDPLQGLLDSARRWAAGIAGMEMLLVALFSALLGSYLTRQLSALRRASYRFAAGDFAYRVPVSGNDDLAQTAQAFNGMAQQLGDSQQLIHAESLKRLAAQRVAEDRAAQLDVIFALSPDGFVSFDAARCVKYANPAFMHLTGIAEAEIVGLDETTFSARLARACLERARFNSVAVLRALSNAENTANERRQKIEMSAAGQRVLEVSLRESQAESVSQILYLRDITHETEVDRLKSEFLSTAAHELRTPMASIYGFAELMLTQEFDAAERGEFLETIFRQSELMVAIINELLDLARIEARRGKDFTLNTLDIRALLQQIVADYKTPNGRAAPEEPPANGPLWLRADRHKLAQALGNVLSNAYKYSPKDSVVRLEFVLPARPEDGATARVGIRITDGGIGMTPAQLSRVFERFYRADASGKVPGTGLGMSIVKEIIELHGGNVELESQIGIGTAVTLWLPAASEKQTLDA
jgi:signal transduction histidine kinase/HAMP domain-containing protein